MQSRTIVVIARQAGWLASACLIAGLLVPRANAKELKRQTATAFDRYIRVTERQMVTDLQRGDFLVIDRLPDADRKQSYTQLSQGRFYIEELHSKEGGKPVPVPGGLVHDWVGVAFIPGATLSRTLSVLQDYNNFMTIYKPSVLKSKLLERSDNHFRVYLQLYRKSLIAVILNADFDIQYTPLGPSRAMSKSYSTRIAEVVDAGKTDEHELPPAAAHGYVWRLDNYWRIEEKDGGVYIQDESIALSRTIPWWIAWLINPLLRSIPRSALAEVLSDTRKAVETVKSPPPAPGIPPRVCVRPSSNPTRACLRRDVFRSANVRAFSLGNHSRVWVISLFYSY
jgi:hypothetical protein